MVRGRGFPLPDLPVPGPRRRDHHLQRADGSRGPDGAGCAGPEGRVAGARVLPGVCGVLAALPPGHDPVGHRRHRPVHPQLQHAGSPLLLPQRGAEPVDVPLRRQPRPLQLPQQELPQEPDQHGGGLHTQSGSCGPGGSMGPGQRSHGARDRRGGAAAAAAQVE